MIEQEPPAYPSIPQSWGIFAVTLLCILLWLPLFFVLQRHLSMDWVFLIFYGLSMGSAWGTVHLMRRKRTRNRHYHFAPGHPLAIFLIILTTVFLLLGFTIPLTEILPMSDQINEAMMSLESDRLWLNLLTFVLLAPVLEELIFRGIMLDGLLRKTSPLKAILLSSFLFALVHLNPWQFISAMVIGLFAGWVYYRTRNLLYPMLIHITNNALPTLSGHYFSEQGMNEALEASNGSFWVILLWLGLAGAGLWALGGFFGRNGRGIEISWQEK